ncbi:MAG: phosphoribosylanthranilate isomerase [Alphaproteobacteria bacterium]|nr:phosphoribosylanthranilate isomerase [Alphaproteobacteria bacterium]
MANRVRVKICCISSVEEAVLAVRLGADAIGLVSHMPSGPGVIDEHLIRDIAARVPPPVATFLLTSHRDTDAIIDQQRRCGANTVQLVDALPEGSHGKLRKGLPGISIVQVIHVRDEHAIDQALMVHQSVDALLLDSGNPDLAVKELGGTGRVHNWHVSRQLVEAVSVPVFLAGGLNAGNVAQAISTVRPFGVDLCSGVRSEGDLDPLKLAAFMGAVSAAP